VLILFFIVTWHVIVQTIDLLNLNLMLLSGICINCCYCHCYFTLQLVVSIMWHHCYPKTTCHHCHNLQHYLLNTTKYFTSNTQILFLTGLHHLHTDLIIQNVHNISLIGSRTNSLTIIQCNSSVGIVMTNITNLIVTIITVRNCLGNEYNNATVLIKQCTNVQQRHVVIEESHNSYGIVGINILGDSDLSYIKPQ